jgi:hypothetical protein
MSESSDAPDAVARFRTLLSRAPAPTLGGAERAVLASRWGERARNELATGDAFAEVARALSECEASAEDLGAARAAAADERRHASVALLVAEYYAGRALPPLSTSPVARASFDRAGEREASLLYVVMHCALGESIAASYLGRCLEAARTELTHAAIRMMLADEVEHARFGFRFLAGRSRAESALVEAALPRLLQIVLAFWLDERGYPRELAPGHGCLTTGEVRAAVREALEELVFPGFEHVGIGVRRGRELVASRGYFGRR